MIFDSHAHYDMEAFDDDRDAVLSALPQEGVCAVLNCACDLASCEKTLALAAQYPHVYAACGVHPHSAKETAPETLLPFLAQCMQDNKCVAVGEIGLDYHYDYSPREVQKEIFEAQLRFAVERDFPVVVHDREAHEDVMTLLRKYRPRGVMHCFSGSAETMRETVALGMYIGLGGAVTFKNAQKPVAVAAQVPLERLLLETDAPYMTPMPHRQKRNHSAYIAIVAQKIAELRGVSAEEILAAVRENACELFGVSVEGL